jgi:Cu-processing system ATP-binding protein
MYAPATLLHQEAHNTNLRPLPQPAMITIQNLKKRFGPTQALDSVSLSFPDHQVMALIGPNGSGKTTLIKCILGLVLPDSGTITVNGQAVAGAWQYRRNIGYMPQISRFPDNMKVGELFTMIRDIRAADGAVQEDDHLIRAFKLEDLFSKRMYGLSGGQRQKISACLAFLFQPEILILDEPTAGLDPVSSEILREKIRTEHARGRLILVTSHVLSELDDLVHGVTFLDEGRVIFSESMEALQRRTGADRLNAMMSLYMRHRQSGGQK